MINLSRLFIEIKQVIRIALIYFIAGILRLRGKVTNFPLDPHRHHAKSFDIARVLPIKFNLKDAHFDDVATRLDILPSHLQAFKEVIYNPPALFEPPITTEIEVFNNALINGRNPIALTSSHELIQESLFSSNARNRPSISYLSPSELQVFSGFKKSVPYLSGKYCVLTSFWDNFGHWIPEHLLKVKYLTESDIDVSSVKFLVRNPILDFQIELLKAAGINSHQIVTWDDNLAIVEELLVPTYPQLTTDALKWIDELIPKNNEISSKYGSRIYLSRQNQNHRRINDSNEVQEVLDYYGFKTIIPEELTFLEQVEIVRNAKILFGPQGSALTLQIFMPPGTIIEAFPQNRVHLFNRQVAMLKSHRHFILTDPRGPNPALNSKSDIQVNLNDLKSLLNKLSAK
jgi:hypothetical protein